MFYLESRYSDQLLINIAWLPYGFPRLVIIHYFSLLTFLSYVISPKLLLGSTSKAACVPHEFPLLMFCKFFNFNFVMPLATADVFVPQIVTLAWYTVLSGPLIFIGYNAIHFNVDPALMF